MKKGFTLAEVLIVIGILGLVADMTLPTLITNVQTKALTTAKQVAALKFEEVMNQMRANEKLTGYATADAFVNEFKNYMKIVSQCSAENIENCFPKKIKTATEDVETKDLKNGADIVPGNKASNYPSSNVGLTFPNGVMAIVNYDKACEWQNPFEGGGTNRQQALTCLSMVYDVNGLKKPNKVGEDIILLNAKLSTCDGVKLGGMCVEGSDTLITPLNTCTDTTWDRTGSSNSYCSTNYWAGAKKACSDKGMRLPTLAELAAMSEYVYGVPFTARESKYNLTIKNDLGLDAWYWSSEQDTSSYAHSRSLHSTSSAYKGSPGKGISLGQARCVR